MTNLILFGGAVAAGYVLAVYTWTALRTFFVGVDQELVWLKARAAKLETRVRAMLGGDEH